MAVYIEEWEWDEANLDEIARHGLTRHIVEAVAEEMPRFRRNKRGRAASHQMIGPDPGGALWTVCFAPVPGIAGRWRTITGWPSDDDEIAWYHRSTR